MAGTVAVVLGVLLALTSGSHPDAQATCSGTTMSPGARCHPIQSGDTHTYSYAEELRTARAAKPANLVFGILIGLFGVLVLGLVLAGLSPGRARRRLAASDVEGRDHDT